MRSLANKARASDQAFTLLHYEATDQRRPTLLEARLSIPAGATLALRITLDKAFLAYAAHRPDAQRGWDLPGAVLVPLPLPSNEDAGATAEQEAGEARVYMHTRTLLLELATPDFSMPYNVIIMTGTLIALIFGTVFNRLTRNFVVVPLDGRGDGEIEVAINGDVGQDVQVVADPAEPVGREQAVQ
jgi:phosphatidylinositol glycan class T